MAGLNEIPAYVRIANDQEMLEMALVENIQRADLNALEVAISYQRLMDECQLTHEALAERVGKDRSTVTNYVRLLKLPAPVQTAVRDGQLSMGHARALAGIVNPALQLSVFKECTDRSLSVRALEQLIKTYEQTPSREENVKKVQVTPMSPEIRKISDQMSHSLGTRVDIKRDGTGKGTITIHFSSDKTFNQVTDLLLTDD
jgi:ParB family chromosome partitioning protein